MSEDWNSDGPGSQALDDRRNFRFRSSGALLRVQFDFYFSDERGDGDLLIAQVPWLVKFFSILDKLSKKTI